MPTLDMAVCTRREATMVNKTDGLENELEVGKSRVWKTHLDY